MRTSLIRIASRLSKPLRNRACGLITRAESLHLARTDSFTLAWEMEAIGFHQLLWVGIPTILRKTPFSSLENYCASTWKVAYRHSRFPPTIPLWETQITP